MVNICRAACAFLVLLLLTGLGAVATSQAATAADAGAVYLLVPTVHRDGGPDVLGHVEEIASDGTRRALGPTFANPVALAVNPNGDVYVVDHQLCMDRRGAIYRIAADGTANLMDYAIPDATVSDALNDKYAIDMAFDSCGDLYVLVPTLRRGGAAPDALGHVDKIAAHGGRTTLDLALANPVALAIDHNDNLYVVDHDMAGDQAGKVYRISPAGRSELLCSAIPQATVTDQLYLFRNIRIGVDESNNVLILEPTLRRNAPGESVLGHVDRIAPDGTRTTLPPTFVNPVAMAVAGDGVYVVEHALEVNRQGRIYKISRDGQTVEAGSVLPDSAASGSLYLNYRIGLAVATPATAGTSTTTSSTMTTSTTTLSVSTTTATLPITTTTASTTTTTQLTPTSTTTTSTTTSTSTTTVSSTSTTTTTLPSAPSLTILYPTESGIALGRGTICKILWTSAGLPRGVRLKIQLYNSRGVHWNLATGLRDTGAWKWKVQGVYPDSADYRIRVSTTDDLASDDGDNDFAIGSVESVMVSGPAEVHENGAAQYSAVAYFNYGPAKDITTTVNWMANSPYASISKKGLLKTKSVKSDQPCTVSATYGEAAGAVDLTIKAVR